MALSSATWLVTTDSEITFTHTDASEPVFNTQTTNNKFRLGFRKMMSKYLQWTTWSQNRQAEKLVIIDGSITTNYEWPSLYCKLTCICSYVNITCLYIIIIYLLFIFVIHKYIDTNLIYSFQFNPKSHMHFDILTICISNC